MNISRPAISIACLLLAASALQASPILPGQVVIPEPLPNPGESVVITEEHEGSFSFQLGAGPNLFTGDWEQGVLVDPFGLTCAGCLDFFYRVSVSPNTPGALFSVGAGGFEGFTTSVGWLFGDPEDGDADFAPIDSARSADGVNVFFSYGNQNDLTHNVPPGRDTAYLIIATNATTYDRHGVLGVIGLAPRGIGSTFGTIEGMFAPTAVAVPEPASLALLGTGIAGLLLSRRRKKAKLAA